MEINWFLKTFDELSTTELYEILKLRSEVFVVEQNCVYLDVDSKDKKALHLFAKNDNALVAYARLFNEGDYFAQCSIGRVVTSKHYRNTGLGHQLMQKSIEAIQEHFGTSQITISAQEYLKKFYESHGFIQTSDTYLEDDIPHIEMKRG